MNSKWGVPLKVEGQQLPNRLRLPWWPKKKGAGGSSRRLTACSDTVSLNNYQPIDDIFLYRLDGASVCWFVHLLGVNMFPRYPTRTWKEKEKKKQLLQSSSYSRGKTGRVWGGTANERHHSRQWRLFLLSKIHDAIKWWLDELPHKSVRKAWHRNTHSTLYWSGICILTFCNLHTRYQLNWGTSETRGKFSFWHLLKNTGSQQLYC